MSAEQVLAPVLAGSATTGWLAELELRLVHAHGRSVLRRGRSQGPLYVQKPFYPEDALAHVYLLHPPGGVAGGDQLRLKIRIDAGAAALFTTPAATKFYRSAGPRALLENRLQVANGGSLEWLPQENLFFSGCNTRLDTRVELTTGARFIGWDLSCLGRPAADDHFTSGHAETGLQIFLRVDEAGEAKPLLVENNCWQAQSEYLRHAWGLGGRTVIGSLVATPCDQEMLHLLRGRLADMRTPLSNWALTEVDGLLIARILSTSGIEARRYLETVWRLARPMVLQREALTPRIWNT